MRKLIPVVLAISLSAALLAGCGGGQKGADAQPGAQTEEKTEAAEQPAEAEKTQEPQSEEVQAEAAQAQEAQAETIQAEEPESDVKDLRDTPAQADGYVIIVKDASTSEPLEGVRVQFCSDTQCKMAKTDATGSAVFDEEPGDYEAHILKAPEGYQGTGEIIELTADNKVAVFMLLKEGEEAGAQPADSAAAEAENTQSAK